MTIYDCPHGPECPGCPLSSQPREEQLAFKRDVVVRATRAYRALRDSEVVETEPAEPMAGYRLRSKLVARDGKLGLYKPGTHELTDTSECQVQTPMIGAAVRALRGALPREVTAIDVRQADAGLLLTLIVTRAAPRAPLLELAERVRQQVPEVLSVALSSRDPDSPQLLGAEPQVVTGPEALEHHFDPRAPWHYAAHGAFTQVHAGQAAKLHREVETLLTQRLGGLAGRRILELHGGSGLLALRLAALGARVLLVESFAPATRRALDAARVQKLSLDVLSSDASRTCEELARAGEHFDAVLVNPPRRGLESRLREHIAQLGPQALVYISCAPSTLARDAADFARLGLAPQRFKPFDMIPLSDAVEALVDFVPAPPAEARVVFQDDTLIVVDKLPHESTTPHPGHARSLLERVQRLPGAAQAAPVHRLDSGTSGLCLFARKPEHAHALRQALAAGQKEYVALAKGMTHAKGTIKRALREGPRLLPARTNYVRERTVAGHSLLAVQPEQGRTHQIRKHLSGLGHPLLGDVRYGDKSTNSFFWHRYGLERPFLHLRRIELQHAGEKLELTSELAADLVSVLDTLE